MVRSMVAGVLALMSSQASAVTWLEYTLIGKGSFSSYEYDYETEKYSGETYKNRNIIATFVVDADSHEGEDYYSSKGSFTAFNRYFIPISSATGNSTSLTFNAEDVEKTSGYTMSINAKFDGVSPDGGFAREISRNGASGRIRYDESFGNQAFITDTNYEASVFRVKVKPVDSYSDFSIFTAVPEPASWAMMIGGVGMAGGVLRRNRRNARVTAHYV